MGGFDVRQVGPHKGLNAPTMTQAKQPPCRESMQIAWRPEPRADPAAINGSPPLAGRKKAGMDRASGGNAARIGRDGPGGPLQTARRGEGGACRFRRPNRTAGGEV